MVLGLHDLERSMEEYRHNMTMGAGIPDYQEVPRADYPGRDLPLRGEPILAISLYTNPTLRIGPLGSRRSELLVIQIKGAVLIQTGCFLGTIEEFTKQINDVHKDNYYGKEYSDALNFISNWLELQKKNDYFVKNLPMPLPEDR